jgi:hypothetical protein
MYHLTLTLEERRAFDWVGDRYAAGEIARILQDCARFTVADGRGQNAEWDTEEEITFRVPEHKAWQIDELAKEEEYRFPCFAGSLVRKLQAFCFDIV